MPDETIIKILLIDDDTQHNDTIRKVLMFEPDFRIVDVQTNGKDGIEAARTHQPDIVLIDINMADMDGITAAEAIHQAVPHARVIMMSVQSESTYMRESMQAGARSYLTKPVSLDELYGTIRKVNDIPRPTLPKTEPLKPPKQTGKIITVYSPQGGTGCTTVAVNLACGLMRDGVKVLLVDTDMQFGDVDVLLYLPMGTTLADLSASADDLDMTFVEEAISTHDTGLKVLMGVGGLTDALTIRSAPDNVIKTLEQISEIYDYLVVDTSSVMDDLTLKLFGISDRVVLVTHPSLASVKHTHRVLELLDHFQGAHGKVELILNSVASGGGRTKTSLERARIEQVLKQPIVAELAQDSAAMFAAAVKGVPLIAYDYQAKRPVTKQLANFAEHLNQALSQEVKIRRKTQQT